MFRQLTFKRSLGKLLNRKKCSGPFAEEEAKKKKKSEIKTKEGTFLNPNIEVDGL